MPCAQRFDLRAGERDAGLERLVDEIVEARLAIVGDDPQLPFRFRHAAVLPPQRLFSRSRISVSSCLLLGEPAAPWAALATFSRLMPLDAQEQHPGDDDEVERDGEKTAPSQHRALLLGVGQSRRRHLGRQRQEIVGEVEPAGDGADDRHDDVADQRIDDGAEGDADDHADGEIDDVAAHGEFLEFLEHGLPFVV